MAAKNFKGDLLLSAGQKLAAHRPDEWNNIPLPVTQLLLVLKEEMLIHADQINKALAGHPTTKKKVKDDLEKLERKLTDSIMGVRREADG